LIDKERKEVKEGALTVCLPQHIDKGSTGDKNALNTHTQEIVQLGYQALEIAAGT
jgi:hypothetical protein